MNNQRKYIKIRIANLIQVLIFSLFLIGCNHNNQIPIEYIGKRISSPILCSEYIEFLNDTIVQFSHSTCESDGYFGGGNFTGKKVFTGKYKLNSKLKAIIQLDSEIMISCNNGSQTKYSNELVLTIPKKSNFERNDWEANFVLEGISSYVIPNGKKWREWQDIQFVYRYNNSCTTPKY